MLQTKYVCGIYAILFICIVLSDNTLDRKTAANILINFTVLLR